MNIRNPSQKQGHYHCDISESEYENGKAVWWKDFSSRRTLKKKKKRQLHPLTAPLFSNFKQSVEEKKTTQTSRNEVGAQRYCNSVGKQTQKQRLFAAFCLLSS